MHYESAVCDLLSAVEEFRDSYEELKSDFGVDVGAHVVFGHLFSFMLDKLNHETPASHELVRRILSFIERAACSADTRVEELVQFSFMEHMWKAGPERGRLVAMLGPRSLQLLNATREW